MTTDYRVGEIESVLKILRGLPSDGHGHLIYKLLSAQTSDDCVHFVDSNLLMTLKCRNQVRKWKFLNVEWSSAKMKTPINRSLCIWTNE